MSLWTLGVGHFNENTSFSVNLFGIDAIEVGICCVFVLLTEVNRHMTDGFLVSVCTF